MNKACFPISFSWLTIKYVTDCMYRFENFTKQNEVIAELKQQEATIIRQLRQQPKEFDPARLEIQIKSQEPENIAAGMGFNIKNEQSVVQRPVKNISMKAQNVQKEPC